MSSQNQNPPDMARPIHESKILYILNKLIDAVALGHFSNNKIIMSVLEFDLKKNDPTSRHELNKICVELKKANCISAFATDEFARNYYFVNPSLKKLREFKIDFKKKLGVINGLKKNSITETIQPELPDEIRWEDIEIKFKNDEGFYVYVNNKKHCESDYKKLGCFRSGTKEKKPDKQWEFLKKLAMLDGESPEDISLEVKRQIKSKLSKRLKQYFDLKTEPFYPYSQTNSYKLKFKIQPERNLRENYESKYIDGQTVRGVDLENSKNLSYLPDYDNSH